MKPSANKLIFATIFITFLVNAYWFSQKDTETLVVTEMVETPVELREFSGEAHLEHWLTHRDTTIYLQSGADFNNYDCDDYALALKAQAQKDGYDVGVELNDNHLLNNTIIGGYIYFIEPRTNEYWKVRLD